MRTLFIFNILLSFGLTQAAQTEDASLLLGAWCEVEKGEDKSIIFFNKDSKGSTENFLESGSGGNFEWSPIEIPSKDNVITGGVSVGNEKTSKGNSDFKLQYILNKETGLLLAIPLGQIITYDENNIKIEEATGNGKDTKLFSLCKEPGIS